jgi:putative transposase
MANTYSQIYIQVIFAVKFRENKISDEIKDEIEKYICGIFNYKNQRVLAIYANPDNIHIFFCYRNLNISIPDLIKVVKVESTNFINEKKYLNSHFSWQEGYGAFSYSKSQKENVIKYVLNQKDHHQKQNFKDEYIDFLNKFEIDFKNEYLFEFFE